MGGSARGLGAALVVLIVGLGAVSLSSCSNPQADVSACGGVPGQVLKVIGQRLDVAGILRNGRMVPGKHGEPSFVSAELHRTGTRDGLAGDVLTFATNDVAGGQFLSVDPYARDNTSWPSAGFDVDRGDAMESRSCANSLTGLTKKEQDCLEKQQQNGQIAVPGACD
jgi:hypothetical protein